MSSLGGAQQLNSIGPLSQLTPCSGAPWFHRRHDRAPCCTVLAATRAASLDLMCAHML